MATSIPSKKPSPERIFQTLNAYQQSTVLRTAIELDLFSAIGTGATGATEIAAHQVPDMPQTILISEKTQ